MGPLLSWLGLALIVVGILALGVYIYRRKVGATTITNAIGKAEATVAWAAVTAYLSDVLVDGSSLKASADAVAAAIKNHVVTATDVSTDSASAITALSAQVAALSAKVESQAAKVAA